MNQKKTNSLNRKATLKNCVYAAMVKVMTATTTVDDGDDGDDHDCDDDDFLFAQRSPDRSDSLQIRTNYARQMTANYLEKIV